MISSHRLTRHGLLLFSLMLFLYLPPGDVIAGEIVTDVTPTSDTQSMEIVGQLGGIVETVFVQNSLLFVGEGARFVIYDITQPDTPAMLGRSQFLPGIVEEIVISGHYAYVVVVESTASRSSQPYGAMYVFDVWNPEVPVLIGFYQDYQLAQITIRNGSAFCLTRTEGANPVESLLVLDLTEPTKPVLLGSYVFSGDVKDYALAGHSLFITEITSDAPVGQLDVLDVSNLRQPTLLQSVELEPIGKVGWVGGLDVREGYAFITGRALLYVYDVSTPAAPRLITSTADYYGDDAWAGDGGVLYLTGPVLHAVDVSDPNSPQLMDTYIVSSATVQDVSIKDSFVYLAYEDRGLRIVDARLQDGLHEVYRSEGFNYVQDSVVKTKGLAINTTDLGFGKTLLSIADISVSQRPYIVSDIEIGGTGLGTTARWDDYLYVSTMYGSLYIIDVSSPKQPKKVVLWNFFHTEAPVLLAVDGDYLLASNLSEPPVGLGQTFAFQVYDLFDPLSPTLVGSVAAIEGFNGILKVESGFAYLVSWVQGIKGGSYKLDIVDFTNPRAPRVAYTTWLSPGVSGLAISDNYLVITSVSVCTYMCWSHIHGEFSILDVSDPYQPIKVGSHSTFANYGNAVGHEDYLFFTSGESAYMMDTIVPSRLSAVKLADLPFSINLVDVDSSHRLLYGAGRSTGLFILSHNMPFSVSTVAYNYDSVLVSPKDSTTYFVPRNTFPTPVIITHTTRYVSDFPAFLDGLVGIGHAFEFEAVQQGNGLPIQPDQVFSINIGYADNEVAREETLALFWLNRTNDQWVQQPSTVNTEANVLTASTDRTGLFIVLGKPHLYFLPHVER